MLKCSVVILNYNTFQLTSNCIRSIIAKSKAIEYEVILVDNGSSEFPPEHFKEEFPQLILIKSNKNLGFAKGNNLGIKHAKGEIILLLNSDAQLQNNAILLAYKRIKSDKSIGAISGKLLYPDGRLQFPARKFERLSTELRELFRINNFLKESEKPQYYLGEAFDHRTEIECDWIWGTFFMFRRETLELLPDKKLPDTFFMYGEDIQWCYEIKKLGYKILYYPDAEIVHFVGASLPSEELTDKYFSKIFPNSFKVVSLMHGNLYAWFLYFIKALHLITLRNKSDYQKAKKYLKFLFGKKHFWLS